MFGTAQTEAETRVVLLDGAINGLREMIQAARRMGSDGLADKLGWPLSNCIQVRAALAAELPAIEMPK